MLRLLDTIENFAIAACKILSHTNTYATLFSNTHTHSPTHITKCWHIISVSAQLAKFIKLDKMGLRESLNLSISQPGNVSINGVAVAFQVLCLALNKLSLTSFIHQAGLCVSDL